MCLKKRPFFVFCISPLQTVEDCNEISSEYNFSSWTNQPFSMSPYATHAPLENTPLNYLWCVQVSLAPYPGPAFQMYFRSAEQRGKTAFLEQQATTSFLQLNIQLAFNTARFWLMVNCLSTRTPRSLSAKPSSWLASSLYWCLWLFPPRDRILCFTLFQSAHFSSSMRFLWVAVLPSSLLTVPSIWIMFWINFLRLHLNIYGLQFIPWRTPGTQLWLGLCISCIYPFRGPFFLS